MNLKMFFAECHPFCLGPNVLILGHHVLYSCSAVYHFVLLSSCEAWFVNFALLIAQSSIIWYCRQHNSKKEDETELHGHVMRYLLRDFGRKPTQLCLKCSFSVHYLFTTSLPFWLKLILCKVDFHFAFNWWLELIWFDKSQVRVRYFM